MAAGFTLAACNHDSGVLLPDAATAMPDAARPVVPPEMIPQAPHYVLGVSAGDIASTRAVIWTQYGGTAPLAAVVWRMNGDSYVEEFGPFAVTPADGGFVHVALEELQPGARYRYAFVELEGTTRIGRSMIGRFRAAIADNASEVLTFGAVACTDKGRPLSVLSRAAERSDLDAFLFVGDNAYCDGAKTLPQYRKEYLDHFGRADHMAVRMSTGMYVTWDDHEVTNDFNPESIDQTQLGNAFKAFFEHAPIVESTPRRIWRSARWGKTAEIFVLDCRSERRPSTRTSNNPQYISPEQMTWLKTGLASSPAVFKIIMNSVPITNMPNVWDAYPTDRWEGYAKQRTDILQYIDDAGITGVLWLAGDFHLAFISKVSTSGPGSTQREVLAGPGSQSSNPLLPSLTAPQFAYKTGTNNYTTLKLDPVGKSVTVGYHDKEGVEFHSESFLP
jgi:alkaline phosphatase D